MTLKKSTSYTTTNSYHIQGKYNEFTEVVWVVFHGMGYLSKYFIKYFDQLPKTHFILCPQAPSKYYQGTKFKHVGASWLTKEDTVAETVNVLNYVDAVFNEEINKTPKKLILLGYSQGVSIATRWLATRKIKCNHLILHSGGIPAELKQEHFAHLSKETKVTYLYGDNDPYITEAKKTEEQLKGTRLFSEKLETLVFKGVHEVNRTYINSLS